jgi:molybdate transport system substrate-binding protein
MLTRRVTSAVAVVLVIVAAAGGVQADELKVLSPGALEPAMAAVADGFRRQTGHAVRIEFATAAEIRERGRVSPLMVELVAAPDGLIAELAKANRVASKPFSLGRVGLGVVMRAGSTVPDISTPQALRAALLAAKTIVYNRASSGQGIETLIQKLGLTEQVAARTERFPDAESVMRHMMASESGAIGFGAPTAIGLYTGSRLRYVGPVPTELQSYTQYAVVATPTASPLAQAFLDYLAGSEARALVARAGVETR